MSTQPTFGSAEDAADIESMWAEAKQEITSIDPGKVNR